MTMNPNFLALPVLIPLFCAAALLITIRWGRHTYLTLQRWLVAAALVANLAFTVLLFIHTTAGNRVVLQMGGWAAPFGITVFADALSAMMLTLTAIVATAVFPFAVATIDFHRERMGFYPLYLLLLMGVNGAFLAGDLFNLYVFFEILLMASFVLLTLGGQPAQTNSGIRYVLLNLLPSTIFLAAAGLAYGTLGTLNIAHMAQRLQMPEATLAVKTLLAGLLLVGFGSKAAIFPLFFWLPASYHTPPPAVTALFGGLLTKVGVYTLFRTFSLLFQDFLSDAYWQPLLLTLAGLTMLVGALGAMAQPSIRRMLSFHIISHVGYMIMGLGVATSGNTLAIGFGLAAALLYLAHHMIVKTALLLAGGAVEMEAGTDRLNSLGGLVSTRPLLAFLFFLAAISLAGIPPFSGFVSKLSLLQITLDTKHWVVAGVSVFVSLITLINIMRLWRETFWSEQRTPHPRRRRLLAQNQERWLIMGPVAALVVLSLTLGIFGEWAFQLSTITANQALDRAGYITAVDPQPLPPSNNTQTEVHD